MTSLDRPLSGDVLTFDLADEIDAARAAHAAAAGRTARTLLKDGPLRVTLILVHAGGTIPPHSADGPITIHVLSGSIRLDIAGREHHVTAGRIVAAAAGVEHAVAADEDAVFLLTVVKPSAH